ncbi:MAG TPA: zinc-ribbon domain-containing protein [Aggregatilineales bacterium]|nr:zinc-ribbon domain-containing protein [Aggregatilineales bacterium]
MVAPSQRNEPVKIGADGELLSEQYCPQCGSMSSVEARYCSSCGALLGAPDAEPVAPIYRPTYSDSFPARKNSDLTPKSILLSFTSRIGRKTYWLYGILGLFVVGGILSSALNSIMTFAIPGIASPVHMLYMLAWLWMFAALTVKRLHDRDSSGWWMFLALIPFVGAIWLFVETALMPGTRGPNKYGP